jgi:DNA replicative helicase MCM subunit Mcm2 (Cdc46/Mcm family)
MSEKDEDVSDIFSSDVNEEEKPLINTKETYYLESGKSVEVEADTSEERDEKFKEIMEQDAKDHPITKRTVKKKPEQIDKELDLENDPSVDKIKLAYNSSLSDRLIKIWYEFLKEIKYRSDDRQRFSQDPSTKSMTMFAIPNTNCQYDVQSDYKYLDQIRSMQARNTTMLTIDYIDIINLAVMDKKKKVDYLLLGYQVSNDTEIARYNISKALMQHLRENGGTNMYADQIEDKIVISIIGYDNSKQIQQLNSTDITKFRRIEGIISGYDEEKSVVILSTVYVCANDHENYALGHIKLNKCTKKDCGAAITHENLDKQKRDDFIYITIQQRYDRLQDNTREPPELNILIQGTEFVENTLERIGNGLYVAVNGVITLAERTKGAPNVSVIEMDAAGIEVLPNQNLFEDDPIYDRLVARDIPPAEIQTHFEKLIRSVAPNLENVNVEKLGVLLALAGTDTKRTDTERIRGNINVMFVGDSSTGKTEFLKYAVNVKPRSSYHVGEQISIVGLLGGIDFKNVTRKGATIQKKVVSLGQFTLCDNGILALDELDKRPAQDYNKFFPTMDDWQTINITKAGLSKTLNANCSVFLALNPITNKGKYDETLSIFDQTNLNESHLSRVDVLFIMTDNKTEEQRERMWARKSEMYSRIKAEDVYLEESADKSYVIRQKKASDELINETFSPYYMRRELMYLEKTFHPKVKPKTPAYDTIMNFWNKMNQKNIFPAIAGKDDVTSVNNQLFIPAADDRKINTLMRLTEACARLNRRHEPSLIDAQYAVDMVKYMLGRMIPRAHRFVNSEKMVEKLVKGLLIPVQRGFHDELTSRMKARRKAYRVFLSTMHKSLANRCETCKGSGKDTDMITQQLNAEGRREAMACGNCNGKGFSYMKFKYPILDDIAAKDNNMGYQDVVDIFNALMKSGLIMPLEDRPYYYAVDDRIRLTDSSIINLLNIDLFVDNPEEQ